MTKSRLSSTRAAQTADGAREFFHYYLQSPYAQRKMAGKPARFDFVTGNPFAMPMPEMVSAMVDAVTPKTDQAYAYKMNEKASRDYVASSLTARHGLQFDGDDVLMTSGGFAAIEVALKTISDPGDELIVNTPWFHVYPSVIAAASVEPVKVPLGEGFKLDLEAIRRAVTPKTRGILLCSPHNPSGRLVRAEEAKALAEILTDASQQQGRPVWLLSDEAFSRIVYDNVRYETPTQFYPHSMLLYTYGKQLLSPGERMGYVALNHTMPEADRKAMREPLLHMAIGSGFCFPNSTLQRALPVLDKLSIDVSLLQENRDHFVRELGKLGYKCVVSEGTFFMLVASPIPDDVKFADILAEHEIFVLPGRMNHAPGWFRISLCAPRETVRDAIDGFARAIQQCR
ncbi:MAG TPA: aminotransferase class I/II-fold pyridoxal phosphate-dependent enzyme [Kofleriaceae bacterium]|jgi:aspartate aminotransferase